MPDISDDLKSVFSRIFEQIFELITNQLGTVTKTSGGELKVIPVIYNLVIR